MKRKYSLLFQQSKNTGGLILELLGLIFTWPRISTGFCRLTGGATTLIIIIIITACRRTCPGLEPTSSTGGATLTPRPTATACFF